MLETEFLEQNKDSGRKGMDKSKGMHFMRTSEQLFAIMSLCTKLPYVRCDEETFDDEILLFSDEKEAKEEAEMLQKSKNPVGIAKIENQKLLGFYSSLFAMGVNALRFKMAGEDAVVVQLTELVKRPEDGKLPSGKPRIENPAFHLTAIYFMQIMRSGQERQEELKALNEELSAHFQEGSYLLAVGENNQVPILKQKDGKAYQPIFTDLQEFMKFNRENKLHAFAVNPAKLPELLSKEVSGVAVNPLGVNVILQISRKDN